MGAEVGLGVGIETVVSAELTCYILGVLLGIKTAILSRRW